jgi:hypothetical protein
LNPDVTALIGFTAALAAMVFMFQSRHHGLFDHHRTLCDQLRELERAASTGHESKQDLSWHLIELKWVRRRYWCALAAFGLVMLQVAIALTSLTLITTGHQSLPAMGHGYLHWVWLLALSLNIFGDIGLAYFNQRAIHNQLRITYKGEVA